jgi:hypothetical protein
MMHITTAPWIVVWIVEITNKLENAHLQSNRDYFTIVG